MGFSFFYNLCRLEEKNPQTIEIYDLWENFFLKEGSHSTKTHKFSIRFFLRCDFEEFLFTFQVCAPQRAEQKEREREREEEEEKERARSLAHSPTLSH